MSCLVVDGRLNVCSFWPIQRSMTHLYSIYHCHQHTTSAHTRILYIHLLYGNEEWGEKKHEKRNKDDILCGRHIASV